MISNLPMYDLPEIREAHVRYWQLIRDSLVEHGVQAPTALSQGNADNEFWLSPQLCLSQTCGLPYRAWLHQKVNLVGTADYALDNCPPGYYRSAIVVRTDDTRDALFHYRKSTLAINSLFSQSGYAAFKIHLLNDLDWPAQQITTGSHSASMQAVATNNADIAAIDAVTWRLAQRYNQTTEKLRVLTYTDPTPGLPYITSLHNDSSLLFKAIAQAITALPNSYRDDLGIRGLVTIDSAAYLAVPTPPEVLSEVALQH